MSNTQKLVAALLIVFAIFMAEILVELLMPIGWVVVILLPWVFGYLIRGFTELEKVGSNGVSILQKNPS